MSAIDAEEISASCGFSLSVSLPISLPSAARGRANRQDYSVSSFVRWKVSMTISSTPALRKMSMTVSMIL